IFLSSISDNSAAIAYEVLDEWDDRVRTSASSVAFTDSSIREKDVSNDLNLSSKRNAELNVGRFLRIMLGIVGGGIGALPDVVIVAMVEGVIIGVGEKDVSNNLNLSSKRNAELNVGRFSRIMLGIVGGGIGVAPDVVIVAMVEGVIIGVGGSRDTIWEDVVVKIDSTPTSLSGFNMLDMNDDIEELSCGS
nr:hypothetical protein [Tanacetum cinerariifolium]